jgi:hypothetical protein
MNKNIYIPHISILLSFILLQNTIIAQSSQEGKTLLGNGKGLQQKDLGFFAAPTLGFTQMDGSTAMLFNLRGGLTVKDKFSVGAYFNTSLNQIKPKSETIPSVYMDYWTIGGFAEYTVLSKKMLHLTFPLYVGYGEVQMDNEAGEAGLGEANFFQLEPSALLELNLHKHVRLNAGAGYRIIGQMTYRNFNQTDISGFTGYVGLKIGLFR